MKESTKHIRAAKRVANNLTYWCCSALTMERQPNNIFKNLFQPDNADFSLAWFGDPSIKQNQLIRSLALLFTAEILKTEGK